jgi:hypothetical protein
MRLKIVVTNKDPNPRSVLWVDDSDSLVQVTMLLEQDPVVEYFQVFDIENVPPMPHPAWCEKRWKP